MSDRAARRPDPVPRLDEVDERILWTLAADARIPNNRLAAAVGIAPSTCLARVRALEDAGVVGYCAFSGWLLRHEWAREDRRAVRSGEVFAMTVAVLGMTLAM